MISTDDKKWVGVIIRERRLMAFIKMPSKYSMKKRKYDITMNTPIGSRYGTINLILADSCINGTLDLLEHSEPFSGSIDRKGN